MVSRRREERTSRNVSLLISMLVRYPEVGSVKYEPRQQTIRLSLLISGAMNEEEWDRTATSLLDTLEVYHLLGQRTPTTLEVERDGYGELTTIAITRDVATLSPEEIYTAIEFFRERFPGRLVVETFDYGAEDEMTAQDEMIEEILADLEENRTGQNLIAIREEGRVMVFQK